MKPELSRFPENVVCLDMVEELTNLVSQIETSRGHDEGRYFPPVFNEHFSVVATVPTAISRNLAGDTPAAATA
jgi:hypothetical protein